MRTITGKANTGRMTAANQNCWEFKKCGRQPGGHKSAELGVCPAAVERSLNGIHRGTNAGRACWVVAGSLCGGKIQGTYARKLLNCWRCDFLNRVKQDEDSTPLGFSYTRLGMERTLEKESSSCLSAREGERCEVDTVNE